MNAHQILVAGWLKCIATQNSTSLELAQDGHCVIPFSQGLQCIVEVPQTSDLAAIFIYVPLMPLPEDPAAQLDLLRQTLQINLFGILTGGCHLGFDRRTNNIVLSFSAAIDSLDEALLGGAISDIQRVAPDLRQRLELWADQPLPSNSCSSQAALSGQLHEYSNHIRTSLRNKSGSDAS